MITTVLLLMMMQQPAVITPVISGSGGTRCQPTDAMCQALTSMEKRISDLEKRVQELEHPTFTVCFDKNMKEITCGGNENQKPVEPSSPSTDPELQKKPAKIGTALRCEVTSESTMECKEVK